MVYCGLGVDGECINFNVTKWYLLDKRVIYCFLITGGSPVSRAGLELSTAVTLIAPPKAAFNANPNIIPLVE